jgi:uncharacterized protein (TIGR02145 family)
MKPIISILTVGLILFFFACKKENDTNKLPSAAVLLEPLNGSVAGGAVVFKWQESQDAEGDNIKYIVYVSKDSVNWKSYNTINHTTLTAPSADFEQGKKYYWRVTTENSFSGTIPAHQEGVSESKVFYFYTTPPPVSELRDSSGHQFVNLYWKDPENLDHVEITFTPLVSSITQPLKVNAGTGKIEITGFDNGTIYSFYVKAFNKLGHVSQADTIKSLPLLPINVHDADFNIYSKVTIGTQVWLRENLRTTKWQDGTSMGEYYYKGSKSDIYGNYYVPAETKNPCPCSYHVPTDEEWKTFERYLGMPEEDINHSSSGYIRGGDEKTGSLIKSQNGWNDYMGVSGNGTDLYGFNALPSGFIVKSNGIYTEIKLGEATAFLSSTDIISRSLSSMHQGIDYSYLLGGYASIRCIKN